MAGLKVRRKPSSKKKETEEGNDYLALSKYLREVRFPWFVGITNCSCIKCGKVNKKMIRVGAIYFDEGCFLEEFDPESKERDAEVYLHWLKQIDMED